ncbi:MAG: hypothetical protein KC912_12960 [Proteobacteria bacterium]|nr:hypothetical protein [Pseudomonadota bacterium]
MSTPFLLAFAFGVINALLEEERIVLTPGSAPEDAAKDAAAFLATRQGHSMISSMSMGLIKSAHVDELFADIDEIREIVNTMGAS